MVPPGSGGLIFLPVSSTSSGRGAFLGIDGVHTISHLTRAIMEGVAYANKRHLEIINASGLKIKNLVMIGGGAKSELWPRIVADVSGIPVFIPAIQEAACSGAAVLAGVGSGVFKSIEEGSLRICSERRELIPDAAAVEIYDKLYRNFLNAIEKV
jgi:sugar (pentulose or hexulose) kinase